MRKALAVLLLVSWMAPTAEADTFRYETEEGTLVFTDDLKRVPARYQDEVEKLADRSLWDYSRVTPVPRGATTEAPSALYEQVQTSADAQQSRKESSRPSMAMEVAPGLWVQLDPDQKEPIRVDREYRWVDGILRPHTIVRQGDQVLAVRVER
jgi:hypothetical protein